MSNAEVVAVAIVWPIVAIAGAVVVIGLARLYAARHLDFTGSLRDPSVLRKGDIIVVGKQSIGYDWYLQIPNVLTRRLKHRFWVHAAIYAGDGTVWEALREGVGPNPLSKYDGHLLRAFRPRYLDDPSKLDRIVEYCARQDGFHYGFGALAFFVASVLTPVSFNWIFDNPWLDRRLRLDRAYFCSELVVDAYASVGHHLSPYDGWRVKPCDFVGNPLLREVHAQSARCALDAVDLADQERSG